MDTSFPEKIKAKISKIGPPISTEELDSYKAYTEITDKSYKLRTVLSAWEHQQTEERKLRKLFALAILVALFIQIAIINVSFFLIGYQAINVSPWVSNTFIISVFSEIVSMTYIIIKYLFPKLGMELLTLIEKL